MKSITNKKSLFSDLKSDISGRILHAILCSKIERLSAPCQFLWPNFIWRSISMTLMSHEGNQIWIVIKSTKVLSNNHVTFFQYGNVLHRLSGSGRSRVRKEENREAIAAAFTKSPKKSIRRASSELNMSYSAVCRMLAESGFKACKVRTGELSFASGVCKWYRTTPPFSKI